MIGKYLGCVNFFSVTGRLKSAGPLNVNLGPPVISETTGATKLKLNIITRGKVLTSSTKKNPLCGVQGAQGPLM